MDYFKELANLSPKEVKIVKSLTQLGVNVKTAIRIASESKKH